MMSHSSYCAKYVIIYLFYLKDFILVTLRANASSIVYGSSVVLTATITSAIPVDTVIWQKEEMNIDMTQEKYTQSNVVYGEVTLTITNFIFNDNGSYRVQVSNSAGITSTWSVPVTLTVTGGRTNFKAISFTILSNLYASILLNNQQISKF